MKLATSGWLRADPPRGGFVKSVSLLALAPIWFVTAAPAHADADTMTSIDLYLDAFASLDRHDIAGLALTLGVVFFAMVTAILLVRTRRNAADMRGVVPQSDHMRSPPK